MGPDKHQVLAVGASFTAEPVEASLQFWLKRFGLKGSVPFAPFAQIFQALLEPGSVFAANRSGLNVVLLRWEDLGTGAQVETNALELIRTLKQSAGRFRVPLLVVDCPATAEFLSGHSALTAQLSRDLAGDLASANGVYLLDKEQIAAWYPVNQMHDTASERLGHIPYTAEYFAALGTAVMRKFMALNRPPYKVAVLDLDNTLWGGVAGEDGAAGLRVDEPRQALHRFLLQQRDSGMLLAICSKNNQEDVEEIFRALPQMPLRLEHFAATRINWTPKSSNLRSLAAELSLGLDSFIFIDDDRKECAEVEANCPEVLTLLLPAQATAIPGFLNQVWAFDRLKVTAEDKLRSESYRQEQQRTQFSKQTSLQDFIEGLQLRIDIQEMAPDQLPRIAQLTQRTNQFNTTTIRRTEAEVLGYSRGPEQSVLAIDVSDRFGDYGLVGAVFYRNAPDMLTVESMMLSCRALGRGVEHDVVRYLGRIAGAEISFPFERTKKNSPAEQFLTGLESSFDGAQYSLSAEHARDLKYRPVQNAVVEGAEKTEPVSASGLRISHADIARQFPNAASIVDAMRVERQNDATNNIDSQDKPRTETEAKLAAIWAGTLSLRTVGIHDDFFEAGGNSLLAVDLVRQVIEEFGAEDLTLIAVLEAPTVAKFAALLAHSVKPEFHYLVALRATGSREPFFCVHGAGGNVLSLRSLAMNLPDDQPFWCLQAKGLDGSKPIDNVEESAALYVRQIQLMQPAGPYYIGGGSYGGLVAYEMARQLHSQGEQVAFLGLFDAYNVAFGKMISRPKLLYCMVRFTFRRIMLKMRKFFRSPASQWPELISGSGRALAIHARKLFGSLASGAANETQPLPAGPTNALGDETGLTDTIIRVRDASMRAADRYIPGIYEGNATIFAAAEKLVEPFEDPYLGWKPVVKGELEVMTIPGNHVTMGDAPAFGEALNQCLLRAQAKYVRRLVSAAQ